jgi:hypothetical protein
MLNVLLCVRGQSKKASDLVANNPHLRVADVALHASIRSSVFGILGMHDQPQAGAV